MRKSIRTYLAAFRNQFTYDVLRNHYIWFGFLWGIPVPLSSIFLDLGMGGVAGRTFLEVLAQHPIHYFFLAHPLLFALVFGAMGTVRHALELENAELIQTLTDQATTDALTDLPNRRYVVGELRKALQRSRRTDQHFAIVLFDLDGFKGINDTLGHAAGDAVLRKAALALREVTREGDVLGRYGGDEFLLISYGSLDSTAALVMRAEESVRAATGLGVSAGVARLPEDGNSEESLLDQADRSLGSVKESRYAKAGKVRRGQPAGNPSLAGK